MTAIELQKPTTKLLLAELSLRDAIDRCATVLGAHENGNFPLDWVPTPAVCDAVADGGFSGFMKSYPGPRCLLYVAGDNALDSA